MKAQLWSTDLVVSIVIFVLMMSVLLFAWNYSSAQAAESALLTDMESLTITVSDSLIRVRGLPDNWEGSSVEVIGLADEEYVLNKTRIYRFLNMSYNRSRELLFPRSYEYYFEMRDLDDRIISVNGTSAVKGPYPSGASFVVPVERYALYNGGLAKIRFMMWA